MLTLLCAIASRWGKHWWDERHRPPDSVDVVVAGDGTMSIADRNVSLRDVEILLVEKKRERKRAGLEPPVVNLRVSPGAPYSAVERVVDAVVRINRSKDQDAEAIFTFFVGFQR